MFTLPASPVPSPSKIQPSKLHIQSSLLFISICSGKLRSGYLRLLLRSSGAEWEQSIDEAILGHNLEVQRILLNQNTHTSELPQSRTFALYLGLAPELRGRAWRFSLPNTRLLILEADPIRSIRHSGRWYNCLRLANILNYFDDLCLLGITIDCTRNRPSTHIWNSTIHDAFYFSLTIDMLFLDASNASISELVLFGSGFARALGHREVSWVLSIGNWIPGQFEISLGNFAHFFQNLRSSWPYASLQDATAGVADMFLFSEWFLTGVQQRTSS